MQKREHLINGFKLYDEKKEDKFSTFVELLEDGKMCKKIKIKKSSRKKSRRIEQTMLNIIKKNINAKNKREIVKVEEIDERLKQGQFDICTDIIPAINSFKINKLNFEGYNKYEELAIIEFLRNGRRFYSTVLSCMDQKREARIQKILMELMTQNINATIPEQTMEPEIIDYIVSTR